MVDAINMFTIQSTMPRFTPRDACFSVSENSFQSADVDFVISSIRVDNLQNVAILEYRSGKTGEVMQQFPTQTQIEAFKRAEQIQEAQKQALQQVTQHNTTPIVDAPTVEATTIEAPTIQAPPSAPVVQAASVTSTDSGSSAGTPHSTQSFLA
ncbi:MAG: hypothetical protein KAI76_05700 [Alphaproteobacteria bacterium]|nr:hypothetical protein [Alphaproteobacteria bacterium]